MFSRLRLKNFKAWDERLWDPGLELAPITLFLGANSAGKTSLLQPLLLLKQTLEAPDRHVVLNLGGNRGDLVDLGTWEQIVHVNNPNKEVGIGFSIPGDPYADVGIRALGVLEVETRFEGSNTGGPTQTGLRWRLNDVFVELARTPDGYRLTTSTGVRSGTHESPEFKPVGAIALPFEAERALGPRFSSMFEHIANDMLDVIREISHLGPLREPPLASYMWTGQAPGGVGQRGEFAAGVLLANLNDPDVNVRGALVVEVSTWLHAMGLADQLELAHIGGRYYEAIATIAGQRTNLIHVGFGVSQVLPIIVLALTAPEGSTVIAEQPELHLHPRAQTALANLLVETAKARKLQFLIETHSEHLFRRLQFLVADEQIAEKDCRLYFVDRDKDGKADLHRLEMNEYGQIANWPPGFFGDAIGETERQIDKMLARKRKARHG